MITEAIMVLFQGALQGLGWVVPVINITAQQLNSLTSIIEVMVASSYFVPYSTLFVCLFIGFIFYQAKLLMSIANWIIAKIPTIS
jgi:hypothetical protein